MRTIAPPEFEHVADDAFDAIRVVEHDAQQAIVRRVVILFAQQLARMVDRRQGDSGSRARCSPSDARAPRASVAAPVPAGAPYPQENQYVALGTVGGDETRAQLHAAGRRPHQHRFAARAARSRPRKLRASSVE
jgi:hypothetical protein